ncbi:hypothetical protein BBJ28_00002613 [Nothophytophthora sp. Chile5]|nr:hypothetical protein BBJ28_00002613 [Nothophytophthora sp. Chile5]
MSLPEVTAVSILLQAAPWVPLAVRRGSSAEVSVQIPSDAERDVDDPQECLVWQFELQEFDIGFQLLENGAAVHALTRYKAEAADLSTNLSADATLRHRPQQLGTVESMMEGRFDDVKRGGVYTFRWDNSYSLVRHKQVQYRFLATSKRAVAAAELAVQESQSRSQRRARRAAAGLPLPHLAKTLARERAMTEDEVTMEHEEIMARFEQAVMDIVSIFISKPDSPLHEGAIRPFILALEAVLRNGIKVTKLLDAWYCLHVDIPDSLRCCRCQLQEEFLDSWPEEPYYELLMETTTVLRDDLGIVTEVEAGEPPTNLRYLGWNRSRSFLFLVLNKSILHRAFEVRNLSKRRMLMEKYYEPRALLYKYANATKLASFLSALNGVQFLLAPYPIDECTTADGKQFPLNLQQCAPEAPLAGSEISFRDEFTGDSCVVKDVDDDPEEIKQLENCTLPRYILHGQPLEDVIIGYVFLAIRASKSMASLSLTFNIAVARRSSIEVLPLSAVESSLIFLAQLRIQTQDIHISLIIENDRALTEPLRLSAADGWVEVIVRLKTIPTRRLALKLDNSYSVVRTKQVQLRYSTVDTQAYSTAWEGCQEMAQSISWNLASKAGGERCAEFMASLLLKEEQEVTLQRNREASGDGAHDGGDEGLMKFSTTLLSRPVSYLVNGLLSTEGSVEACDQCLTPFSFFSRQHSCPSCQKVVCVQCSRHYVQINGKGPQLKVCDGCFIKEKEKERKRLASLQGNGSGQGGERPEFAALRRDPAMEKYFKMLSFGVPASAVAQKMTQDDMPPEKVIIFAAGPIESSASPLSSAAKYVLLGFMRVLPDSLVNLCTFRKVHWTSLETKKANETIWSRVTARRKTAPIALSPHDFQELEYLFGNPTAASPSAKTKSSQSSKKSMFSALDPRRSNNISIGLNQFKTVGGSQAILTALNSCDFEFLTADRLANLQDIAPNSVEMKRYSDFRGSRSRLEPAEKFLVEMCEISRVADKIGAMLFASQFEHQQQELRGRIQVITRACYEVLQSERLARCFELVLAIGNLLNTGTELEDAHGVTLASLLKLSETKAIDQSMTLLQFIIKLIHVRAPVVGVQSGLRGAVLMTMVMQDRGEGDVLLFIKDLSSLTEAKRFSNMICESQARALQHGITQLEQEIKEDMVDDLKRFNKAEALRKRRFEEQSRRPPLVQARKPVVHVAQAGQHPLTNGSQGALLAAIRGRSAEAQGEQQIANGRATNDAKGEQYEPREYKMESSFITIMRERLMNIKVAFEDVEMEVETLSSVWEATARYLAEDPAGSSSEYVFNLLNRFLLDVKVAKSLLFRKGLSFATEANALLPHAHVGSTVATTFGSGVITALRIADRRIEVKFPWSRETYLSPSCILSPGSLVRCRRFGVGIIRETSYDVGFCDVRFQFGYGKVRVEDLTPETSSNKDELRLDVLRAGFAIYDPVVTPFGCGYIQSIRGNPRSSTAVISVGLLTTETDVHDRQRISTGIAFVPASRVQRNY